MRIGSLFSGGAGLDRAVEAVFGGEVVWFSEIDKAASKVLAHRWPDVPNLGSITEIDWKAVEPVDVLCGGFPCQDVSAAGKRAGIKDGTRSGLWAVFAEAIDALRPQYVLIENVRGLLSATAHRTVEDDERDSLEPSEAVVGDGAGRPFLRAAGAVLGDLSDLGYDAVWATVAASAVGAPHRRERVFIVGTASHTGHDAGCPEHGIEHEKQTRRVGKSGDRNRVATDTTVGSGAGLQQQDLSPLQQRRGNRRPGQSGVCDCGDSTCGADASDAPRNGWDEGRPESARLVGGFDAAVGGDEPGVALLPTPVAHDGKGSGPSGYNRRTPDLQCIDHYLPTPSLSDVKTPRRGDQLTDTIENNTHTINLADAVEFQHGRDSKHAQWGKYAPAIARWEQIVGPAPAPTEPNKNGNPRLSAAFSEWLMGWPAGWVTDPAIGISRNDQLRIVGNGVCPQQAIAALRYLLGVTRHTHTHRGVLT